MSIPNEAFASMPKIAEPFFNINSATHDKTEHRVDFNVPWCISVQALGGTALIHHMDPMQAVFVLELHMKDKHHQAQRAYANCQERTIQAVIYCLDFVKEFQQAGGRVFIKSILGPANEQSVFPFFAHISPIMQLFDASFSIRGAEYQFIDTPKQRVMAFNWIYDIVPTKAQSTGDFVNDTFQRIEGQSIDPVELLTEEPAPVIPEPSKAEKRKEPEPETAECVVCLEDLAAVVQTVVIPCGHTSYCWECAAKLERCAICRTDIGGRFKMFNN